MYKHVNAIVERKYYYDDSLVRYKGKQDYYKYDICASLYPQHTDDTGIDIYQESDYELMQKVWHYVTTVELDNIKKNIFCLYYYERKKQEEIAYLLEVSQAYVVKVLKQFVQKIEKYLHETKGCEPDGQLLLRF